MSKQKTVVLECLSHKKKVIKVRFSRKISSRQSTAYMVASIKQCFKHGFYKIIFDMENIEAISGNFVATLIEVTSKVRRKDGDIKIINLSENLYSEISGFNALTFLLQESKAIKHR